jgi:hypothetical protein
MRVEEFTPQQRAEHERVRARVAQFQAGVTLPSRADCTRGGTRGA